MPIIEEATEVRVGSSLATAVYLGNHRVWPGGWTPADMTTIFWYDAADLTTIAANGNQVTQMLDKSGNGWTLAPLTAGKIGPDTGTRTLNGLNVLEWSKTQPSTNQIVENDGFNQDQPFCIAGIVRFDDEGLSDQDFFFSGTDVNGPRVSVRRINDQLQILTYGGTIQTPVGTATENNNYLASFFFNSTSSTIRIDGEQLASGTIANNSFTTLNIGGNFGADQSLDGFIAELVAFDNPTDQEIVEGYLAWKWGLQGSLPAGHPYKNSRP